MSIPLPEPFAHNVQITTNERGRGLTALRALAPGDIALAERPICFSMAPSHCQQCSLALEQNGHLCSACRAVSYCCKRCQKEHWPLHRLECRRLAIKKGSSSSSSSSASPSASSVAQQQAPGGFSASGSDTSPHSFDMLVSLALRCILMERCVRTLPNEAKSDSSASSSSSSSSGHEIAVKNGYIEPQSSLVWFRQHLQSAQLLHSHVTPVSPPDTKMDDIGSRLMIDVTSFLIIWINSDKNASDEDIRDALTWTSRVKCNAIDIYDEDMRLCGHALTSAISLINHSCVPNCALVTVAGTIQVRVIEPIQPGQELLIDYCGEEAAGVTSMRRFKLRQRWQFHCKCELCSASDAMQPGGFSVRDVERIGLRCGNKSCSGYIALDQDIERPVVDDVITCATCGWIGMTHAFFAPVQKQWKRINQAIDLANEGKVLTALRAHEAATSNLSMMVSPYSLWIASALQSQMEILRALGEDKARLRVIDRLLTICEAYHPRYHPLLVSKRVRRFQCCIICGDMSIYTSDFDDLLEMTRIAFGTLHPMHNIVLRYSYEVLNHRQNPNHKSGNDSSHDRISA